MRFLLIDRIVEIKSGQRARAIKNVAMSEDFLTYHFPSTPIMPGALIAESAVQLAGWIVREATDFELSGLVTAFERARFMQLVRPGDQLELDVKVVELDDSQARFSAIARCRGKKVASGRFRQRLVPTGDLEAIEGARRLFEILCTPLTAEANS